MGCIWLDIRFIVVVFLGSPLTPRKLSTQMQKLKMTVDISNYDGVHSYMHKCIL